MYDQVAGSNPVVLTNKIIIQWGRSSVVEREKFLLSLFTLLFNLTLFVRRAS